MFIPCSTGWQIKLFISGLAQTTFPKLSLNVGHGQTHIAAGKGQVTARRDHLATLRSAPEPSESELIVSLFSVSSR